MPNWRDSETDKDKDSETEKAVDLTYMQDLFIWAGFSTTSKDNLNNNHNFSNYGSGYNYMLLQQKVQKSHLWFGWQTGFVCQGCDKMYEKQTNEENINNKRNAYSTAGANQ